MSDSLSTSDLDEIEKALKEAEYEAMSICPEDVFKELYLPVFSGQVVNDRVVQTWIHMAGGVKKRVKVVGEDGSVLFEVPAWYTTDHMRVDTPKDTRVPSFSEVVAQAMMCVNHSPLKAVAAFQDATLKHLTNNIDKTSDNVVHGEWEKIFARYDITTQVIMGNFRDRIKAMQVTKNVSSDTQAVQTQDNSSTMMGDGYVVEE